MRIATDPPRVRFSDSKMVSMVASVVCDLNTSGGAAPEIVEVKVAARGERRYKVGGGCE